MTRRSFRNRNLTNLPVPAAIMLALVFSLVTSSLLFFINSLGYINNTTIALIFLLPVGLCASLWGLLPAITSALVSFLAFNFLFIPNLYTFQVKKSEDLIVLLAFLTVAIVISELTGRVRRNLASATARENEALALYELNNILIGTRDENTAARLIMDKVDQTLRPGRIEILIESTMKPILLVRGIKHNDIDSKKPFVVPLQSPRELIGEIRVWMDAPILESEERLLKIFGSQSALTIERIRLLEEARKSRILEESDRLKSSLLSSVSHELRSPLAAIKTSVSSLRTEEVQWDSDARKELLITVEEEIDHLNMLVGNLLDMSRIEAGVLIPQKKPNILSEIISIVIGRLHSRAENYKIIVNVSDELPFVNVDFVQIQQVFTNLLTNSLKYSPLGSDIRINAVVQDANFILVTLTNQSPSLPDADLDRIFEKFYRNNPSEQVTGSGLGLSICKGIIIAHGCKIWAENNIDGLAFHFTLPIYKNG